MTSPVKYIEACGFIHPIQVTTRNPASVALAFSFSTFNPELVRAAFGKHLRFSNDGVFVYRMAADRAARVDTSKKTVLLVSGRAAVRKLVSVSKKNAQEN